MRVPLLVDDFLRRPARLYPDKTAIVDGSLRLSYREYEARVNLLVHAHECTFMCVYDLNRFSGRAIMDVLSTHPMVVMGDRVLDNPYYVEPRDFLARLVERGEARAALQTH